MVRTMRWQQNVHLSKKNLQHMKNGELQYIQSFPAIKCLPNHPQAYCCQPQLIFRIRSTNVRYIWRAPHLGCNVPLSYPRPFMQFPSGDMWATLEPGHSTKSSWKIINARDHTLLSDLFAIRSKVEYIGFTYSLKACPFSKRQSLCT